MLTFYLGKYYIKVKHFVNNFRKNINKMFCLPGGYLKLS